MLPKGKRQLRRSVKRLGLQCPDHEFSVAGCVNRVERFIDSEVMHVHGGLLLLDDVAFLQVQELDETVMVATGCQ